MPCRAAAFSPYPRAMRRRAVTAALAGFAVTALLTASPAPATPAPAGLSVSSLGSSVMSLYLDKPLTVGAGGLAATFGPVSGWGAVVLARQAPGVAALSGSDWTGVGVVSDGHRQQNVPLGGASRLPAGHYGLYLLSPKGYTLSARLALPGVESKAVATWSRQPVTVGARLDSLVASVAALSDRIPAHVRAGGAFVMMGATTGTPVAHDLAACLVEGVPPTGAETECGTSQLATYREDSAVGYGDTTLAVSVPKLPTGSYTGVLRGEGTGIGPGVTFATLQWAWTAPLRTAVG